MFWDEASIFGRSDIVWALRSSLHNPLISRGILFGRCLGSETPRGSFRKRVQQDIDMIHRLVVK